MTIVLKQPSKRLLRLSILARVVWTATVGFWVLVTAAWLIFDVLIVPRIGNYRTQLQEWASKAVNAPVTIDGLTTHRDGLLPWIEVHGLKVGLSHGDQAPLILKKVIVTFSPRSLFRLGVEQLVIDEPELNIRRDLQGKLTVAGFAVQPQRNGSDPIDWLLSQTEIVVRNGTLRWLDEQRHAPELVLSDVNIVIRNGTWRHALRLDAKPPAEWGERITLVGRFYDPLLQLRRQDWRQWSGQAYAQLDHADVASLSQYVSAAEGVNQGQGAIRFWVDLHKGEVTGTVMDMAVRQAKVKLDATLAPLELRQITGRISTKIAPNSFEVWTQNLSFTTTDGIQWPGGNVRFARVAAKGKVLEQGSLTANALDLGVLAHIADRLPFNDRVRAWLHSYRPEGQINNLQSKWTGPMDAPATYSIQVKADNVALATDPESTETQSRFGFSGVAVNLSISESGGKGVLSMNNGSLWLPTVFEDALLPLDALNADVEWEQVVGAKTEHPAQWRVQANRVRFSNADAQGEAQVMWRSDLPLSLKSASANKNGVFTTPRSPGYLDLSGSLSRADAARVHRYLPLVIPASARHYVRDAVVAGVSKKVTFKVKGDLAHLPLHDEKYGEFRIAAQVQDVTYQYLPASLQPPKTSPWPALNQLQGELIFQGSSMVVRNAKGSMKGLASLKLSNIQAKIPDFSSTKVIVSADAVGALDEMLTLVRTSPVADMTSHALDQTRAKGNSQLQLSLQLPIHELEQAQVQGALTFSNNDVDWMPEVPPLSQVNGRISFSHKGFDLEAVKARVLGGAVQLSGGMSNVIKGVDPAIKIQAQGLATAQGLQSVPQWSGLAHWMRKLSGNANYSLQLNVKQGVSELLIQSQLEGLEVALPEPFLKKSGLAWPLRIQAKVVGKAGGASPADALKPVLDTLSVSVKDKLSAKYERQNSAGSPQVLRGSWIIGAGDMEQKIPLQGVSALASFQQLDVDAWLTVLPSLGLPKSPLGAREGEAINLRDLQQYLPNQIRLHAKKLDWQGRTFHEVNSKFIREQEKWHADLDAKEFKGYAEYRAAAESFGNTAKAASSGVISDRIYARLSRLSVPPTEQIANAQAASNTDLAAAIQTKLPAVDVEIDRFAMHGKEWGRLTLKAENQARMGAPQEWRLQTLQITNPESQLTASGNWAPIGGASGVNADRRTVLNFSLDISDAGRLLDRFGMTDVVRKGSGQLAGQIAWIGSPFSPDTATMTGKMQLDVVTGQFLQADPGAAKLLGVLSLQSLPRRLALDFRDVFSKGFSFDFVRGDVQVAKGVASTNNLQMKGVNAAVLMEGTADLAAETQNLRVIVVPEINAMTASLVATAINPVIGLGSFLAQVFLRGPLIEAATQELHIDGTWAEPRVTKVDRRTGATPSAPVVVLPQSSGASTGQAVVDSLPKNEVQP